MFYFLSVIFLFIRFYPPAKTFDDPAATDVQPDIASPILPQPLLLIKTVVEPTAMGLAWGGHIGAGRRWVVFTSPCRDIGILFANTFGLPTALVIPEQ
jgi:hypothetical protein